MHIMAQLTAELRKRKIEIRMLLLLHQMYAPIQVLAWPVALTDNTNLPLRRSFNLAGECNFSNSHSLPVGVGVFFN